MENKESLYGYTVPGYKNIVFKFSPQQGQQYILSEDGLNISALEAVRNRTPFSVIGDKGLEAGQKYYWNLKITQRGGNVRIGVSREDNENMLNWFTGSEKGWGIQGEDGNKVHNWDPDPYYENEDNLPLKVGDIITVKLDM